MYSDNIWLGESLANHHRFTKLKPSKLVVITNNVLADLLICQTFLPKSFSIHFCQTLSTFAKHYHRQTFPLYSNQEINMSTAFR